MYTVTANIDLQFDIPARSKPIPAIVKEVVDIINQELQRIFPPETSPQILPSTIKIKNVEEKLI